MTRRWLCRIHKDKASHTKHNLVPAIRPVSRLIRHSLVATPPTRNSKLNPSAITNYPSLNASLMQAIKDTNEGKHVPRRRELLWVEEGRGE